MLANGDNKNAEDIKKCFEITGADGVMIGRGALGNPWIFRNTIIPALQLSSSRKRGSSGGLDSLFQGNDKSPSLEELKKIVLRHAELHLAHYGEQHGLATFRKHLLSYFKGEKVKDIKELKNLRARLAQIKDMEELKQILGCWMKNKNMV